VRLQRKLTRVRIPSVAKPLHMCTALSPQGMLQETAGALVETNLTVGQRDLYSDQIAGNRGNEGKVKALTELLQATTPNQGPTICMHGLCS